MKNTEKITSLKEKYETLRDERFVKLADGNLSKLVNFRTEFDESFDCFFDDKELRQKYNAWNNEENCIDYNETNSDMEAYLDETDEVKFIEFLESLIGIEEDKLQEMKNVNSIEK